MAFDYKLLAKYLIGELSSEEMKEIAEWRASSVENEHIFSDLLRLRIAERFQRYNNPQSIEKALEKVNARIITKKRVSLFRAVLRYAAVLLLLFSISLVGYEYFKPEKYVIIAVKPNEKVKKVVLNDGTSVWLRGASSLKYAESFSLKNRKVSLQGEAFFDVAKNALPFLISTGYLDIKVLGTAFDVKVDKANKEVETTLVRGKIALLDRNQHQFIDMSPGEKVTYSQTNNRYTMEHVDVNLCATWRLNQFVFENATLREIASCLSEKFNVNVNIESSPLAQHTFRCVFNKDESLQDILNLLKYMAPISYRIEGQEVFIWKNKTKKK